MRTSQLEHVKHGKKLIEFAKAKNATFKLRHNRMYIGNKCLVYDSVNDNVLENSPSVSAVVSGTQSLLSSEDEPRTLNSE